MRELITIIFKNKTSKSIINLLEKKKELTVTEIIGFIFGEENIQKKQSIISQTLKYLKKYKIVTGTRQGKEIYYSLNLSNYQRLLKFIDDVSNNFEELMKKL